MASTYVYFIEKSYPAKPDQSEVDYSFGYLTPKIALKYAKDDIKSSKGPEFVIKDINQESFGLFVKVGEDLALVCHYKLKAVELKRV